MFGCLKVVLDFGFNPITGGPKRYHLSTVKL